MQLDSIAGEGNTSLARKGAGVIEPQSGLGSV